ncbi:MAG: hypothetical protein ABSC71_18620 [Candidatus Acidiferrales bacterium]
MYIAIQIVGLLTQAHYQIDTPGCIYTAKGHVFNNVLTLSAPDEKVLATVKRKFEFLHTHYEFDLQDGNKYQFKADTSYKNAYACTIGTETYTWFFHRGWRNSLFLHGSQIASMKRSHLYVGGFIPTELQMNDDADLTVVLCFALATCEMSPIQQRGSFDPGYSHGGEDMPFDERWQPS